MKIALIPFILILAITACDNEPETKYSVDAGLSEFVDTFFSEANARGIVLNKANLIVKVSPADEIPESQTQIKDGNFVRPTKISNSTIEGGQRIVRIEQNAFTYYKSEGCRNYYNTEYCNSSLEIVIFHELGHIMLNREYLDIDKTSLMSIKYISRSINYDKESRKILLDELFNQ